MTNAEVHPEERPWALAIFTLIFLVVYTAIHIILNLTDNGSSPWTPINDVREFIAEISGPLTIGICTSLILISYGMFLHSGKRDISIAYPRAFLDAFVIFIIAIILVQISGHMEIYANSCAREESPCAMSWPIKLFSSLSFAFSWLGLWWLEKYYRSIYGRLERQIPRNQLHHIESASFMLLLTGGSIIITGTKLILSWGAEFGEKFYVSAFALILEVFLALLVFEHYFRIFRSIITWCAIKIKVGYNGARAWLALRWAMYVG